MNVWNDDITFVTCHNLGLGLTTKARVYKGAGQDWVRGHISCSWECKRVWGNKPSHSQVNSHFGSWHHSGFPNFQRAIVEAKTHWIEKFLISLESSWNIDVWKGLHDPFGQLKHKLWPKERLGLKLTIWLPTIKSWESPQFPYMQVACTYHWKAFDEGYNFAQDLISIGGLHTKLWALQIMGVPTLGQKVIWMLILWATIEYITRGKVAASLKFGPWWVLWIWVCPWFVLALKML
jgi:hypothetical protein